MNQYQTSNPCVAQSAGPAQAIGGTLGYANKSLAPEVAINESEIAFASQRVRSELDNLGLTVEALWARLAPVIDHRPTDEKTNPVPSPSYGSSMGGMVHGYANELQALIDSLQRLTRQLAL